MGKLASSARHSLLSDLTWVVPKQQPKGVIAKFVYYLKSHPLLFLILLTPGIPEYLSASSQLTALVINPFGFLFQLGSNIGLYGSGVILIREAMIRWKKRLGLSLPSRGCVRNLRGRTNSLDTLLLQCRPSRHPRLLRSLAGRELGMDHGSSNIPLRL